MSILKPAICHYISRRIIECEQRGHRPTQIRDALGITRSTLSRYRNGLCSPDLSDLQEQDDYLADLLGDARRDLAILILPFGLCIQLDMPNEKPYRPRENGARLAQARTRRLMVFLQQAIAADASLVEIAERPKQLSQLAHMMRAVPFETLIKNPPHRTREALDQAILDWWFDHWQETNSGRWYYTDADIAALRQVESLLNEA